MVNMRTGVVFLVLATVTLIELSDTAKVQTRTCDPIEISGALRGGCTAPFTVGERCLFKCRPGCTHKSEKRFGHLTCKAICGRRRPQWVGRWLSCSCDCTSALDNAIVTDCAPPYTSGEICTHRCNVGLSTVGGDRPYFPNITRVCTHGKWIGNNQVCNSAFTSPGYPSNYPNSLEKFWKLSVTPGKVVAIRFAVMDIEYHLPCFYDILLVYDGLTRASPVLAELCGVRPVQILTTGSDAFLIFSTNSIFTRPGFSASFSAEDPPPKCGNPTVLKGDSGSITSPQYPYFYPNKAKCSWVISVTPGKIVVIRFESLRLNCNHELAIYNGTDKNAPLVVKMFEFCRWNIHGEISTDGSNAFLLFTSDRHAAESGFSLTYTAEDPSSTCSPSDFTCLDGTCVRSWSGSPCDGKDDCPDGSDELACVSPGSSCGVQPIHPSFPPPLNRIVSGEGAVPNSWPWQAFLKHREGEFLCGGTLISPLWVVTAAHCVHDFNNRNVWQLNVVLGKHHFHEIDETEQQLIHSRRRPRLIKHENYTRIGRIANVDIALLKLSQPATLNRYVRTACLPNGTDDNPPPGTMCVVTGWGNNHLGYVDILKQARVPLVSDEDCKTAYPDNDTHPITEYMLCAGHPEGGHGPCHGDSGGPLVCFRRGTWVLDGITSWGDFACSRQGKHGVYTRVTSVLEWIKQNIN